MHGLKTIHPLNREATEAREICEKHGVALGDIPAPTGPLPTPKRVSDMTDDELLAAALAELAALLADLYALPNVPCACKGYLHKCPECAGTSLPLSATGTTVGYDLPNVDESAQALQFGTGEAHAHD